MRCVFVSDQRLCWSMLLGLLCVGWIGWHLIASAPAVRLLSQVRIESRPQGVVLGRDALGQAANTFAAEAAQLWVGKDDKAGWLLQNLAIKRAIDARTDKINTHYIRQWALQAEDRLHFPDFVLHVTQADADGLRIEEEGRATQALWDGSELKLNERSGYAYCRSPGWMWGGDVWKNRVKGWTRDWDSLHKDGLLLFSLGGQVHCANRWPHAELALNSVRFYWQDGRYWLRAGADVRFRLERGGQALDFQNLRLPVSGHEGTVNRLVIGRTYYRLDSDDAQLRLTPTQNQSVFAEQAENPAAQAAYQATGVVSEYRSLSWIGAANAVNFGRSQAWLTLLLALGLVWALKCWAAVKVVDPVALYAGSLALWLSVVCKGALAPGLSLLWCVAVLVVWRVERRGWLRQALAPILGLSLALNAIGALALLQLAAGADNTRWLRFASDFTWVTGVFWALVLIGFSIDERQRLNVWRLFLHSRHWAIEVAKSAALLGLFALLLTQLAINTETGLGFMQPVELAKFAVVLFAAQALWNLSQIRETLSRAYLLEPLAFIRLAVQFFLGFVVLVTIPMIGVKDFSPVLIIVVIMAVYLWRMIPNPVQPSRVQLIGRALLYGGAALALIVVGVALYQNPPPYDSAIPQAERLRVWANPYLYAEASSQLLQALQAILQGGWWGVGWGGVNGRVMAVPAIQDDFMAAFWLNHFGGLAGLLLWLLQVLWIAYLISLCERLVQVGNQRNHWSRQDCHLTAYMLYGLVWLHALHWVISWGNVLGLLPIMGQPMTWLSAGNSHLVSIGLPAVVLALQGARLLADDTQSGMED